MGVVNLSNLPAVAQAHFPLCMSNLMQNLAADRHLRHMGRQQLGLFLKVSVLTGLQQLGVEPVPKGQLALLAAQLDLFLKASYYYIFF